MMHTALRPIATWASKFAPLSATASVANFYGMLDVQLFLNVGRAGCDPNVAAALSTCTE
jgi:hypothetical protein